jgi:hypothetical protein
MGQTYRFVFNNDIRRDTSLIEKYEDNLVNIFFSESPYTLYDGEPPCESFTAPDRYTERIGDYEDFESFDDFKDWLKSIIVMKVNHRDSNSEDPQDGYYLIFFRPDYTCECGDGKERINRWFYAYSTEEKRDKVYDLLNGFQNKYGRPEESRHILSFDDLNDDSIKW